MGGIMKLNLGAGADIKIGNDWVNYDIMPMSSEVKQLDLENMNIPHEDNTAEYIQMLDVLEHLKDIRHAMNECHRVLKKDGVFYVEVPRFPHNDSVKDPTHVRFFVPETFKYFSDYTEACQMYGFKQWKILAQIDSENRIKVKMQPIK